MLLGFRLFCSPTVVGIVVATCLPQAARADEVIITVTGSVLLGIDITGVFGFTPNTDLTGKPYTLTFIFDDTLGTKVFTANGSYIESTSAASNPGRAVLQIGDGSFAFGTSSNSQSSARLTAAGVNDSSYGLQAGEATLDSTWNNVQGTIIPAQGTTLTTNPSWGRPFFEF